MTCGNFYGIVFLFICPLCFVACIVFPSTKILPGTYEVCGLAYIYFATQLITSLVNGVQSTHGPAINVPSHSAVSRSRVPHFSCVCVCVFSFLSVVREGCPQHGQEFRVAADGEERGRRLVPRDRSLPGPERLEHTGTSLGGGSVTCEREHVSP